MAIMSSLPLTQTGTPWIDTRTQDLSDLAKRYLLSIPRLASGTYTPTLTAVANVAAKTAYACQVLRVGISVTVSGQVDIDPTAGATLTQLGISLPLASALTAASQCAGTAVAPAVAGYAAAIRGDATNDRAELAFTAGADAANRAWYFSFTYQLI